MTTQANTKALSRRSALGLAGAAAGSVLATPALAAEDKATIEWKMVTSWPKNLPGPGVTAPADLRPDHADVGRPPARPALRGR